MERLFVVGGGCLAITIAGCGCSGCSLLVLSAFELERFSNPGPREHVERQCAEVDCDGVDRGLGGPIAAYVACQAECLVPNNLVVLLVEAVL